jgi:hypothetical protein
MAGSLLPLINQKNAKRDYEENEHPGQVGPSKEDGTGFIKPTKSFLVLL